MSDGEEYDGEPPHITGAQTAGISSIGAMPFELMRQLFTMSADIQQRTFALLSGQTLVNMRAMARAFGMKQSFEEQVYRGGIDISTLLPLLEDFVNAFPEPQRTIMRQGIMTEEDFFISSHDEATLKNAERFFEGLHKMTGRQGELSKEPYNHKMLAEHADGSVDAVDPERIISLFQATPTNGMKKPDRYPRIIFTSSHASGESLDDVTKITHGIEALARDSFGKQLNVTTIDKDPQPGETMILYACDSRESPPLNGIDLTRRLNEIKHANDTGEPDQFYHASEGAKRIAKTMLACMCENFYDEQGKPAFNVDDPRPLSELFEDGEHKLRLSNDARRIAQHFQLMGYSKGGNVVSDAVRYLERELSAVDKDDKGIVRTPKEWPVDRGILREEKYGVRSIMNNINTACIAAREHPLTEAQKEHGLRRVGFTNTHDPLTKNYRYPGTYNDELYETNGSIEDGHNPELALGTREARGYFLDDADVNRRMKEFFAAHYNKAAIANVFTEGNALKIEAAPSTPDAMMFGFRDQITAALEAQGITNPVLTLDPHHIGIMTLTADQDFLHQPDAVVKMGRAFDALRDQPDTGLLVATSIRDVNIPHLVHKAYGRQAPNNPQTTVVEGTIRGRTADAPVKKDSDGRAA